MGGVTITANSCIGESLATTCSLFIMKYVTISTWAKLAGINRESVCKHFKSGELKGFELFP